MSGLLAALEERLGHRFADRGLLEEALTHSSYANEQGLEANYERLELLGDSVLGLVTVEWLITRLPRAPEGELARLKSRLVSEPVLAEMARHLDLGAWMRLGVGEERSGGRDKRSLLADVFESVLGALYLDGGFEVARRLTVAHLEGALDQAEGETGDYGEDAKTALQELAQARGWALPEYELIAAEGPDHQKLFTVVCRLAERSVSRGVGRTKKRAEQRAAAEALAELGSEPATGRSDDLLDPPVGEP